jgi:hypothetical protein
MPMFNTFNDSFWAGKRPSASTGTVTLAGLVSYIDMTNPASYAGIGTTATDLTVNGLDAILVGNPVYSNSYQGTVALDGSTQYLITENLVSKFNPGNGTVTVDIWLRPTDNGVVLNEQGTITSPRWYDSQLEIVNGILRMGLWNGSTIVSADVGRVNFGTWQNYIMVYDGVTLKCYINGTMGNAIDHIVKVTPWDEAGYGYHYGIMGSTTLSPNLGDGTRLAGNFGLIRIYNTALTKEEVIGNCNATRGRYNV